MDGYKLQEISINQFLGVSINKVKLCDNVHKSEDNYYSLIIGNNGTGKSILLSKIASYYNNYPVINQNSLNNTKIISSNKPVKTIAITSSISDKFPNDDSFKPKIFNSNNYSYNKLKYIYLGARNKAYSYSKIAQLYRAFDILFENYSKIEIQEKYLDLFNYLNYEPIIKISFTFSQSFLKKFQSKITPELLIEYINKKIEVDNISYKNNLLLEEMFLENIDKICDYMNISKSNNNKYNYSHSTTINFSKKNIKRKNMLEKLSNFEFNQYKTIQFLKKFKIVENINFRVFKKDGSDFQFEDSSSGEANILTTLISLIPLINDNCLILIDEPEISLHPQWQSRYIDLLKKIFNHNKGCHIIIASHSHFIATDLPPKQSSIIALKRNKKDKIVPEYISKSTFGWSTENILYSVFNMKTNRNYYLERELYDLLNLISKGDRENSRIKEIITNLDNLNLVKDDPLITVIKKAKEFINEH